MNADTNADTSRPAPAPGGPLAARLAELARHPLPPGRVLCLGLRLAGADPWPAARRALALIEAPAGGPTADDLRRAARFLHDADAVRHLLGRALLRHLLHALGLPLPAGALQLDAWGRPLSPHPDIHFSISHSARDVWLACSRDGPVGIDVEAETPDAGDLAPLLHPEERAVLAPDAGAARRRLWVRKEAVAKALGQGLSLPLASLCVATGPVAGDWLHRLPEGAPRAWSTHTLPPDAGIDGAVAVIAPGVLPVIVRRELPPGHDAGVGAGGCYTA